MRRWWWLLIVALVGGGAAFAFLRADGAQPAGEGPATIAARRGTLVEQASATGTVEPDVSVELKPRGSGQVIEVLVEAGQTVVTGDILLKLDPVEREEDLAAARAALVQVEARLREAEASVAVARAQATEARASAAVRQRGAAQGLLPAEERRSADSAAAVARTTVTLREAQVAAVAAEVEQAKLRVATAQRLLDETVVRAPIDATVLSVAVARGSVVASGITNIGGGTAVLTLADLSTLLVVGQVDEAHIGRVVEGLPVEVRVDAFPDRTFRGQVRRVSPLGTATNNVVTFPIEVAVADQDAHLLRPGMSADVEVVIGRHEDALLLPVTALRSRGRERFVLLPSGERRAVKVGATDGTDIVITEGLREGEGVAAGGATAKSRGGGGGRPFGMPGPPPR
jgi:HlyD family secretion protein